jgi:hypothetical protein
MGSITAQPAEEIGGERWDARRAAQSRAFLWRDFANSLSNQCLERIWAKLFDLSQNLNASAPA